MYIVKVYEDDKNNNAWLPDLKDGYQEVDTYEEALEIRKYWLTRYPSLCDVKIFKTDEVIIDDTLREDNIKKQQEEFELKMKLRAMGFDSYDIINQDGERQKIL